MSADNGIYLLQAKDGWRVIHAQCIDNLYWWPVPGGTIDQYELRTEINPSVLYSYFKKSEVYEKEGAWHKAMILFREVGYVEYGIGVLEGWADKEFPKQCCDAPKIIMYDVEQDVKRCMNCGEYE